MAQRCSISLDTLAEYKFGRMDMDEQAQITQHLHTGCLTCEENLRWLQTNLPLLEKGFELPPASLLQRAKRVYRERRKKAWQLILDSRLQSYNMAMARGNMTGSFLLVYQTAVYDIEVYAENLEDTCFYLIGKVRSRDNGNPVTPESVVLTSDHDSSVDENDRTTSEVLVGTFEGSEFHIASVSVGVYSLSLVIETMAITIDQIQIGE